MISTENNLPPAAPLPCSASPKRADADVCFDRRFVLMGVADQRYAMPVDAIQEVLAAPELSTPPGMPRILVGFMDVGGTATPVVSLARLFDLPEALAVLYTPILLLRDQSNPLAIKVEQVFGTALISDSAIARLSPRDVTGDAVVGMAMVDDRCVVVLSPDRLLLRQERTRLAELQCFEQNRLAAIREGAS
jgi:purine-binding chemotaxis protein CheW